MKLMVKIVLSGYFFVLSFLGVAFAADLPQKNHEFTEVRLGYPAGHLCSFQYAPVYFCDTRHISEFTNAIETKRVNFNRHYIVVSILERREYYQKSLVAIDVETGIVYPVPFDFYSGDIDAKGNAHGYGRVSYSIDGNEVCVVGAIVAHRQIDSGKLCWNFDGAKFIGHYTPYMN